MASEPITILLIDDHRIIRDTWAAILDSEDRFLVVGSAANGNDGVEMVRTLKPQVVLTDINMLPDNGFVVTQNILQLAPETKIICVSMHAVAAYAKKIFKMGAVGYVTKNSSKEELLLAIDEVAAGKNYICEEVKQIIFYQPLEISTEPQRDINNLSKREIEVAKLIKNGMSSREISAELDIALKTVEAHRYNILKKLHFKNTASLVNFVNENYL